MLEAGQKIHGFTITRLVELTEYRSTGVVARHDATGCEIFHTVNDDEENLFAFIFKTVPENSNGVAHILEHTVLCGSEAFPVKDPFLLMMKGSMQTFLNAFTFPDKTVYPASSTVKQDLFNLMEVYGDAVFFPLLKQQLFSQEGHRLEFDDQGKLVRTGIVYNEMKGNYSTHDSVAGEWCYRGLFPDTPYAYDSGGDPREIPNLSYDDFIAFHRKYYHPSNTLIYLYGNTPTEEYLEFLNRRFLTRFGAQQPVAPLVLQPRWTEPRQLSVSYPAGEGDSAEDSSSITLNWLLFPVEDSIRLLSWEVLTEVLMGSTASPLQKLVSESNLGDDLSPTSGFESELRETVFSVGIQGTGADKAQNVEELFLKELNRLVRDGLNKDLVEGILRKFEFRSREIKGGGPFGLRLLRKLSRAWLHGADPEHSLLFEQHMAELRRLLTEDDRYFENLIAKDLLDNPHRTTVTVYPDAEQNQREAQEEAATLAQLEKALEQSTQGNFRKDIAKAQEELTAFQGEPDSPEAMARIPFLAVSDIPTQVESIPGTQTQLQFSGSGQADVWYHDVYTNGITYLDMAFDVKDLSPEEQMLLPLLAGFIPSAGLPGMGYDEVSRQLAMVSGGFSAYPEVNAGVDLLAGAKGDRGRDQGATTHAHLFFRLKALDSTVSQALGLVKSLVAQADFTDLDHLAEVFFEMRNDMKSSILPGGSSYAALRAEAGLHPVQDIEERLRGLTQYLFLEELAGPITSERKNRDAGGSTPEFQPALAELARALADLRDKVITPKSVKLNITAQDQAVYALDNQLSRWLGELGELRQTGAGAGVGADVGAARASGDQNTDFSQRDHQGSGPAADNQEIGSAGGTVSKAARKAMQAMELPDPLQRTELLEVSSKVAFVAAAMPGAFLGSPEQAYEQLLSHILKTGPLWEEIRMKGGAYGAHAGSDGMAGIFSLASYRDPNTHRTLEVYLKTLEAMGATTLDQMTLDLAKIGSISRELKPLSPGEKGMVGFKRSLYGISDRIRQHRRDVTLAAVAEDLQLASARLAQSMKSSGRRTVLAGKELLEGLQGQTERQAGDQPNALGSEFGAPVLRRIGR